MKDGRSRVTGAVVAQSGLAKTAFQFADFRHYCSAMATASRLPHPIASDAWMHEQQLKAEWEAAEWKRIRAELANPPPAPAAPEAKQPWYEGGSIILKALVRFGIGAFGAWMGYIAALDSQAGEFEVWLSVGAGFIIALSLSFFGVAKQFVALFAEIMRWGLILGFAIGAFWLIGQMRGA